MADLTQTTRVSVQFVDPEAVESEEVVIRVVDYVTGAPITGATVRVAGGAAHTTDKDGLADVGALAKGRSYSLYVAAAGYQDTANDMLANDSFTLED